MTGMSRALMGYIVDEVFDGAIEDTRVIEDIYAAIKRHETLSASPAGVVKPLEWRHDGSRFYAYCGVTDTTWTAENQEGRDRAEQTRAARIMSAIEPAGVGVRTYTDLERKYIPLAKKIVNGRSLNHPYPGDDTTRIVGFRVPADVAGLSEALFALDTIRAVLAALKGDEQ